MSTANGSEEIVLKILVIGDPATGKTSIIKRYVHSVFNTYHKPTIGIEFSLKQMTVGNRTVKLQLWDIAGQDRFGAMSRVYYKDAYGAFVVYDISRSSTFDTVAKWKDEIDSKILLPNGQSIPVVLLGNKCDLDTAQVDQSQVDRFVEERGFAGAFNTSAKLNTNIDKAARFLVDKILEHEDILSTKKRAEGNFQPGLSTKSNKPSGCC